MRRVVLPLAALAAVLSGTLVGCTSTQAGGGSPASVPSVSTAPSSSVLAPSSAVTSSAKPRPRSTTPRPASSARHSSAPPQTQVAVPPVSFPPGSGPLVALNPGHNGANATHTTEINRQVPAGFGEYKACDTTGTETNAGYPEHAFNWDVTLRVRTILQAHGVRVILTRPDDAGVGPCVDQRAAIGNQAGVRAVISIHADGAPSDGHGFHVCYASRPPAGAQVDAQSRALSTAVHDALARSSGLVTSTYLGSNGYYPRSDLAGLNLATVPATFLELGNMRNAGDAALQTSATGRQRVAAAVAAGILAYLGR
jgi:N-acetylmuramoyl-L-alanine amidase